MVPSIFSMCFDMESPTAIEVRNILRFPGSAGERIFKYILGGTVKSKVLKIKNQGSVKKS